MADIETTQGKPNKESSQPWWSHIDKIFYINLDHRTDRRTSIETLLRNDLNIPESKIERISAVKHSPGFIGCAMSHLHAVKLAIDRGYKNVCILEDDFQVIDINNFNIHINNMIEEFNVIMLAMTPICLRKQTGLIDPRLQPQPGLENSRLHKIHAALGMPGYIVAKNYLPKMKEMFETALTLKTPIDMETQKWQSRDRWYGFYPPIARQAPGFSDIEQKHTDYGYLEIDGAMLKFV